MSKTKKILFTIIYNTIIVAIIFGGIEFSFNYFLNNPNNAPTKLFPYLKNHYNYIDRNVIQFFPESAQYDSQLYYTLKPGQFDFINREFNVRFNVNSVGLRDDESSLQAPEIIVLGDSYAMGWGVEQAESFAELLEKETNKKVLNTGVSSFGTVREFAMLQQVRQDSLQYIIIQYCSNDFIENKAYLENDNQLKISSKESYQKISKEHIQRVKYYPFKYLMNFTEMFSQSIKRRLAPEKNKQQLATKVTQSSSEKINEYDAFLNVIAQADIPEQVQIIVFDILAKGFIEGVATQLNTKKYAHLKNQIHTIDFSSKLKKEQFYILDEHLRASGHQVIFNSLKEKLIDISNNKNTTQNF